MGANVDLKARSEARATTQTSNPGRGSMTPGGVGRNIAENIARLGDPVHLISVVGSDPTGDNLLDHTAAAGVRVEHVARTDRSTGTYTAVLDADGELIVAISDMAAVAELGPAQLHNARDIIAAAGVVVDHSLGCRSCQRTPGTSSLKPPCGWDKPVLKAAGYTSTTTTELATQLEALGFVIIGKSGRP